MSHPHEAPISGAEDVDSAELSAEALAEVEAELAQFEKDEKSRLGLERSQWVEPINTEFYADQRAHTTLLISGLTFAHDHLACAAFKGIGYNVEVLGVPDNAALQIGKEFGNRGQCNPTYFTVGNLVKHLQQLRDDNGLSVQEIVDKYIFLTAGACGPCRFGTYVTEYRKALRDAGFEGFRVLLFQQQGGVKQATGKELGLKVDFDFTTGLVRALIAGDVLNLLGYRLRPYEVEAGSTDAAVKQCRLLLEDAFANRKSILWAMWKCRKIMAAVKVDRTVPKPVVSVIGEFWAMTTEGDGNYHLQSFLEKEGAEVDIQGVTNWLLFMVWENKYDTLRRLELRQADGARKGLEGKNPQKKLMMLAVGDKLVRVFFQTFAKIIGLNDYHLPDMDQIAALAKPFYDNENRGGEAHMEVGKLIHFVEDKVNHMTVSVKPFGCMPSSGVSDGVQSVITTRWPEAIFLPLETTGDQQVNAHSRVQMMLFKARQKAREEYEQALAESGMTEEQFKAKVHSSRWSGPFVRPPHKTASVVTNMVYAVG